MSDDRVRCEWSLGGGPSIGSAYVDYHDTVWGVPQRDARTLFEFLTLEGAQAGLSWSTILRKIDSTIGNARAWLELDDPVAFLWGFTDGVPLQNAWSAFDGVPAETDGSR